MLKRIQKIIKNPVIFILLILLLILIIFKALLGNTADQNNITPTPTQIPTPAINNQPDYQSFTTTTAPKYQGEPNFRLRIDKEIREAYPLFNQTPFVTENWSIDYTNKMEVTVTLKQDTPEIRQEVIDWMTNRGADPTTHKIIWKTE